MVCLAAVGLVALDPGDGVGMAVGLAAGAALVDYGTGRGDVVVLGAVTGVGVGVAQALVLCNAGSLVRSGGRWRTRLPGRLAGW